MKLRLALVVLGIFLSGCGGGGSSDGILVEGTLAQGSEVGHEKIVAPKHGAGESIENVSICALSVCSVTDSSGHWGFVTPDDFAGGNVEFSIVGHGIDAKTVVTIPGDSNEIVLDLVHQADGSVVATEITIDGETRNQ